jgi:hypothetical protein
MPYAVRKHYAKNPPLAQLYMVIYGMGIRFYERPSLDSLMVGRLYGRMLFHGSPAAAGRWVRRLPSEGGGFCWADGVKELS